MNMRFLLFVLGTWAAMFASCVAATGIDKKEIAKLAQSEGAAPVWKYFSEHGVDKEEEANYFLYLYSTPRALLKDACVTRRTDLDLKIDGENPTIVNRAVSDRVAFKACRGLRPSDFVEISNNSRGIPIEAVLKLVKQGVPGFGGRPDVVEASAPVLRHCFESAKPTDLSEIVVYSETEVSGLFSSSKNCPQDFEVALYRGSDGTLKAVTRDTILPYTTDETKKHDKP